MEKLLQEIREVREITQNGQLTTGRLFEILNKLEGFIADQKRGQELLLEAAIKRVNTNLSYSEQDALQAIGREFPGGGLLVSSKIADAYGITRSVIVNALSKLQAAGVVDSRSLGMKGTHITILDARLWQAIVLGDPEGAIKAA